MFTRTTGFFIVPAWIAAMSWLVANDVWPGIAAEEPPPLEVTPWLTREGQRSQYNIRTDDSQVGMIWREYIIDANTIQRMDMIWVESLSIDIAPLRLQVTSLFTRDGLLDEFTLKMDNSYHRFELHGERFHSDFSFTFEGTGLVRRSFKLPLSEAGLITGAFSPFSQLSGLEVGKRWRMQVFNPVAAVTGFGDRFIPMLVEVTGKEIVATREGPVDCHVVSSGAARALVDQNGLVRVQEITLPVIGRLTISHEAGFDEKARHDVRQMSFMNRRNSD